jgi:glycogen operon protein
MLASFASRICGSSDIYAKSGKGPESSINFITCHDGFTLNDLVSYRHKHNEANGEDNHDGTDCDFSANCGIEGETTDIPIETARKVQIKSFLLTLLISRGVPMLLGGGEFRRAHPILSEERFYTAAEVQWLGPDGELPDWTDPNGKQIACLIREDERHALCLMFNAGSAPVDFNLPIASPGVHGNIRTAIASIHELAPYS